MQRTNCKSFFKEMRNLKKEIQDAEDREVAVVYLELERYVLSCKYSKYKYASVLVKMLLEGRSEEDVANTLGISESTIRYHESTSLSKKLYEIFGKDFFRLMKDYRENKRELDRRLFLAFRSDTSRYDYCMSDVISEIKNRLDSNSIMDYNIKDCANELAFISKYSLSNMKKELSGLDIGKLEYLMKVLDGEKGSVDERFNFVYRIEEL